MQDARQILDPLHQIIVLGAGPRDADRVAFLERVIADQMGGDLAGDADERDRIHQRVGQTGHRIGGAGAGRDQHRADLAGRARIAFRRMHRALLVAHENVPDFVLLEDRVIDRQDRAAGIAEDVLHALIGEGLDDHFGPGHLFAHDLSFSLSVVFLERALVRKPVPTFRGSRSRELKKGHEGPSDSAPYSRVSLPPAGAPTYNKSNKIARHRSSPYEACAGYRQRPGPGQAFRCPKARLGEPRIDMRG